MTETRYEVRKLPAPAAHPLRTFGVYDTIGKGWVTATLGTNQEAMSLAEAVRCAGLHNHSYRRLLVE